MWQFLRWVAAAIVLLGIWLYGMGDPPSADSPTLTARQEAELTRSVADANDPRHPTWDDLNPVATVIDAEVVTRDLPLAAHEISVSDNGRHRERWNIVGADFGQLELIGNDRSDADVLGWQCSQYDKSGNVLPLDAKSMCRKFLFDMLSKFIENPQKVTEYLVNSPLRFQPGGVRSLSGDLSFEVEKNFFFVRRLSRH